MAGVFISYRRDDTRGYAGHLYGDLVEHLGRDQVFIDIDTLQPGADYVKALEDAIADCEAVLVLIGPRWASITDAAGNRRLDDPGDIVRQEVAAALIQGDNLVIPVLVGNARMPLESELPEPLKTLRRRNAFELSDGRWDYDIESLVTKLSPVVKPRSPRAAKVGSSDFRAWLEPERIVSNGPERTELVIENLGTETTTFLIDARRKDAGLDITVPTSTIDVEARGKRSTNVEVAPRSGEDPELTSSIREPQALGFVLYVSPSETPGAGREVSGTFVRMPAAIDVRLGRREIASAGAEHFDVRIENPGRRSVEVALEAEDHSGQCTFEFDQPRLTIDPRSVAHAALVVSPPERHAPDARWSFDVRATPIAPPGPPVHAEGTLVYAPPRIAIRLTPPELEAAGPGMFTVEVENHGASDVAIELSASDPTHTCTYVFDRTHATVGPGMVVEFGLTVTPPADHPADARWRFGVTATPTGLRAEPARVSGVLTYRPPSVELGVTPAQQSARRQATYDVSVHNPFSIAQTVGLSAVDRSRHLNLRWKDGSENATVEAPPRETKHLALHVTPVTRHQRKEALTFTFFVSATPIRPPGAPIWVQAQFVARPDWRPGRLQALIVAAVILLALILFRPIDAIGWPELIVVAAPFVGGLIVRSRWWVLLYPAALALGLQLIDLQPLQDGLGISRSPVTAIAGAAESSLLETLRSMNSGAPGEVQDLLTSDSLACERRRLVTCGLTEWNIVALSMLSAFIGIVTGKVLFRIVPKR